MFKIIGGTVAAATLAFAGSAGAATISTVDFEDYAVGYDTGPVEAFSGTPHTLFWAAGSIGFDPTSGIGNYLELGSLDEVYIRAPHLWKAGRVTPYLKYAAILKSFDIYIVGGGEVRHSSPWKDIVADQWTRVTVDQLYAGNSHINFNGATVRLDNFVFQDNYLAVPEPATWAMMIIGFASVGNMLRRSRPSPCAGTKKAA